MRFERFSKIGAAACVALGLSSSLASAVTVMNDGDVFQIGAGLEDEFIGDVAATGGPGDFEVLFQATSASDAVASVTIGNLVASTFTDLELTWLTVPSGDVVTTPITPIETTLATSFAIPDSQEQILIVSWLDSLAGAGFDIEVTVAPVPLPFAGALLLTGLVGLGVLRRRQSA